MSEPTHIRLLGHTRNMCSCDFKMAPKTALVVVAVELSLVLEQVGIRVNYVNIRDAETNPDGLMGRFELVQFKTECDVQA